MKQPKPKFKMRVELLKNNTLMFFILENKVFNKIKNHSKKFGSIISSSEYNKIFLLQVFPCYDAIDIYAYLREFIKYDNKEVMFVIIDLNTEKKDDTYFAINYNLLSDDEIWELIRYCKDKNIDFKNIRLDKHTNKHNV